LPRCAAKKLMKGMRASGLRRATLGCIDFFALNTRRYARGIWL
jgi:hypothetical protein